MNARFRFVLILCVSCWAGPFAAKAVTVFTKLVTLDGTNGFYPTGNLCLGSDGKFYGTTQSGNVLGHYGPMGNVFRMDSAGNIDLVTYFSNNVFTNNIGACPVGALIEGFDGNYYCTTLIGGSNIHYGTIARLTPGGILSAFASFNGTNGYYSHSDLITDNAGNLYGTTTEGGIGFSPPSSGYSPGLGTVFKVSTNAEITTLHAFTGCSDGANPGNGLTWGPDGYLYGTTTSINAGGNGSINGTIFRISSSGGLTNLHTFNGSDGSLPISRLTVAQDGKLYGVARNGGPGDFGTIFSISTNGDFSVVACFNGTNGSQPRGQLLALEDGCLYGTTFSGGPSDPVNNFDGGTVFRLGPDGVIATLHSFARTNSAQGENPIAGLIQGADGRLYGSTSGSGGYSKGSVFRLSVPMSPVLRAPVSTNNSLHLSWKSMAEQTYQLQYTTNFLEPGWLDLGDPVTATNGWMQVEDTISGPQRFYRVAVIP